MSHAKKLNLKDGMALRVLHAPDGLTLDAPVSDEPDAAAILVFVRSAAELEPNAAPALEAARRDAIAWIAYPKAKQLGTDLNRDILWRLLEGKGVRPVRQVSLDEVWSALRFRPA